MTTNLIEIQQEIDKQNKYINLTRKQKRKYLKYQDTILEFYWFIFVK